MSQAIRVVFLKQGSCIIWKKVRLYLYYTRLDHPQYGTVSVVGSLRQQLVVVVVVVARKHNARLQQLSEVLDM